MQSTSLLLSQLTVYHSSIPSVNVFNTLYLKSLPFDRVIMNCCHVEKSSMQFLSFYIHRINYFMSLAQHEGE